MSEIWTKAEEDARYMAWLQELKEGDQVVVLDAKRGNPPMIGTIIRFTPKQIRIQALGNNVVHVASRDTGRVQGEYLQRIRAVTQADLEARERYRLRLDTNDLPSLSGFMTIDELRTLKAVANAARARKMAGVNKP